jgi:CRP-like cAMP-binding protein
MLVYRSGTPPLEGRGKAAIRFLPADEPFIFDCDGRHVAHCVAITDCDLLCIDRSKIERLAAANPVLRGILYRAHANEIDWLLQAAGAYDGISQDDQPDPNEMEFVTDLPARRRQHESTAS